MRPATAALLACVCAVYAQKGRPLSSRMYTWDNAPDPLSYIPRYPSQNPEPVDSSPELESPQRDPLGWSLKPWQTPDNSQEEVQPQYPDVEFQQLPESVPPAWVAPAYYRSLTDLDDAIEVIESHFTNDAFLNKNNKNFRYVIIAHVVDALTKHVARNGWKSYEDNYTDLVKTFINHAVADPRRAAGEIECVFNHIAQRTDQIRKLINNKWTQFVCNAQPTACDTVIYAIVRMNGDEALSHQADLLITMGRAATNFIRSYASAFDAVSTQNVYIYILQASEIIKDLVGKNAVARKALYPDGEPRRCYQQISPRVPTTIQDQYIKSE